MAVTVYNFAVFKPFTSREILVHHALGFECCWRPFKVKLEEGSPGFMERAACCVRQETIDLCVRPA